METKRVEVEERKQVKNEGVKLLDGMFTQQSEWNDKPEPACQSVAEHEECVFSEVPLPELKRRKGDQS